MNVLFQVMCDEELSSHVLFDAAQLIKLIQLQASNQLGVARHLIAEAIERSLAKPHSPAYGQKY